jgi:hypothetical protein
MKILRVAGAGPQFAQASVASEASARRRVEETFVQAGRLFKHDLMDGLFDALDVRPPTFKSERGLPSLGVQVQRKLVAFQVLSLVAFGCQSYASSQGRSR